MHLIDWIVLLATLGLIVGYGVYKTRTSASAGELLSGSKNVGAMTIGLGIMATQASAITFLSTPGQAYAHDMGYAAHLNLHLREYKFFHILMKIDRCFPEEHQLQ